MSHTREAAHRELAEAEQSLAARRDALEAESRLVADELTQMRSERDDALTGEIIATTQATKLQHLVDQLRMQISELTEQRDTALRRADRSGAARQQLDVRLHETLETAKSEREDWTEYVRSVKNRALSDVDRARQEVKELQAQLSKTFEQHRALEKQLHQDVQAAQSAAAAASQSADILRGRCDALEERSSSACGSQMPKTMLARVPAFSAFTRKNGPTSFAPETSPLTPRKARSAS